MDDPTHGIIPRPENPDQNDYLFRVSLKAVILNDKGHVLVVKEHGREWWDIPGGGLDHGETIKDALARELREEVSMTCDFEYATILAEDPRHQGPYNMYQMRITFVVKPQVFEFEAGDDGDEIAFIDPANFANVEDLRERKVYEYSKLAILTYI